MGEIEYQSCVWGAQSPGRGVTVAGMGEGRAQIPGGIGRAEGRSGQELGGAHGVGESQALNNRA